MITVIDLNLIPTRYPLLSEVLIEKIGKALANGKKVLLTLNRRGAMSTLVCRDCGWSARCPSCDLMMRVHHTPQHKLLCHLCEVSGNIPFDCPKCGGNHLVESGARIQNIDTNIRKIFPEAQILLVEKDFSQISQKALKEGNIFIGTQKISSLPIENLGLTAFLLVESDLAVPVYNIEEEVYTHVRYFFHRSDEIVLQTRSPKIPLIQDIVNANFRTFFQHTIAERKQFRFPPFTQMVMITITEQSESTLKQRVGSLASALIQSADISKQVTVTYDHMLSERRQGKYFQKILIRGPDMLQFLEPFRSQLVRGRGIEVEWL